MIKRISVLLLLLALSMTALFGCSQTKETKHASAIINTDKTNKEENLTPVTLNEVAQLSNYPVWFDGTNINEAAFCEEFLHTHKILFANNVFFTPEGRVTDDLPLRGEIFESLKHYAINNVPRKVTNILEVMKLAAYTEDFPPEANKIHLANGTLYIDGTFIPEKPDIVRMRLPVNYNPDAPEASTWLSFLDQLLYPEDIPTLQEFIGYCLIPSNKGQRMMMIKGNGGEGKSQIGAVLNSLLGSNMKDGSIGKISENRFARADLEHILLCVDDPYLAEKMKKEAESIFLWAFKGLQRLVRQDFKFTESPRIKANRENVKRDNNNVLEFLESEEYIRFQPEASASSKELYESYRLWCEENSMTALKNRSFSDAMIAVQTKYNLVRMYIVIQCKLHIIYFSGWLSEVA